MATIAAHFANIESKIIECLDEATSSIIVVVAWFKNENLFSALSRSLHRGVDVHIAINNDEINFGKTGLNFTLLQRAGANIYLIDEDLRGLIHHKFCIVDNLTTISGSYNWTNKANSNHENVLIVKQSSTIAKQYISEFYDLTKSFKKLSNDSFNTSMPSLGSIEALSWWEKLPLEWQYIFADKIKVKWHMVKAHHIDLILAMEDLEITNTVPKQDEVALFDEGVKSFLPLYALRGLKKLSIKNKNLSTLSFLTSMAELTELLIESDSVKSFIELASCKKLVRINLKCNSVIDLGFVASLDLLTNLIITTKSKIDAGPLATCKSLVMLNILDADIQSFESISQLDKLSVLGFARVSVDSLKLKKQLPKLKRFTFADSRQKFNMNILNKLPKSLEELTIDNIDDVNKVSMLSSFVNLKHLTIERSKIDDIKFIKELKYLEKISLRHTSVTDISPLLKLPKLAFLFVWDMDLQNVISSPNTFSNLFKSDIDKRKDNVRTELKAFKAKKPQCYVSHTWFNNE